MNICHSVGAAVEINNSNIKLVEHYAVYDIHVIIRFIYFFIFQYNMFLRI